MIKIHLHAVADPAAGYAGGGEKYEIYAAIFFVTYFHRAGEGGVIAPSAPLDPLLPRTINVTMFCTA